MALTCKVCERPGTDCMCDGQVGKQEQFYRTVDGQSEVLFGVFTEQIVNDFSLLKKLSDHASLENLGNGTYVLHMLKTSIVYTR